jgi:pseudouridine kinase
MSALTNKEQEVLNLICEDPQISQADLAKKLNITRSSASVHITNLIKKRYIEGKGYIVNKQDKVCVIGASMIDIVGRSFEELIPNDSNPGRVYMSPGGVSRNISENLARMGVHVSLITALCDDAFGNILRESCTRANIDISECFNVHGGVTTTYVGLLDHQGALSLAISDTLALDQLPVEHIAKKDYVLKSSELIVIDAVLPEDVLRYIVENFSHKRIFVDPISVGKARHIKPFLKAFDTIKCNRLEAQYLADTPIVTDEDVVKAAEVLQHIGIKNVFISLGSKGVYYKTKEGSGFHRVKKVEIANATGAGDAFMAGLVYSALEQLDVCETVELSSTMAALTLESLYTVNPNMSLDKVKERMVK